ncbi:MAG: hypothetical protein ACJ8F7_22855 [Gemmataceae bacterium]
MTAILRKMPFFDQNSFATVRDEAVRVKGHQIIAWMSLTPAHLSAQKAQAPRFPVILDTGNTESFSIRESHLRCWAGIDVRLLPRLGMTRHGDRVFPLHEARLWLHRNRPGERDIFGEQPPYLIEANRGVVVYPDGAPGAPRLPLLGLRALEENRLHLKINAERRRVSLRSRDWATRLFGWW